MMARIICSAPNEKAMQSNEKFMADLLAIVISRQHSEDQQVTAAMQLATAYAAELRAWLGKGAGKSNGDQDLISLQKAIIAEQNRHQLKSTEWHVLYAAELVLG